MPGAKKRSEIVYYVSVIALAVMGFVGFTFYLDLQEREKWQTWYDYYYAEGFAAGGTGWYGDGSEDWQAWIAAEKEAAPKSKTPKHLPIENRRLTAAEEFDGLRNDLYPRARKISA